jgi:4-amino-4-deoxy-L-arabinose transferase-like glycosyltransferase
MKIPIYRNTTYLLISILVVAAIVRLIHINQPFIDSFSWRQSSTAMMAENFYRRNGNIFYPEVSWDGPGPSYNGREFQTVSYITALLYTLLGQHDWVGRSVVVLFSLWGIFAFYQLVSRIWDRDRALMSAAIIAIFPGNICLDRSFLPDPAMVALVITSFWMLIAYLQTDRWHYLLLATLFAIWGFLTKLPGLMIGIPMLYTIFVVLRHRGLLRPKKLIVIGVAAISILLPVAAYYLWARHIALTYPPYHFAGSGNWIWDPASSEWWQKKYFFPQLYNHIYNWLWTYPIMLLVAIGLFLPPHYKLPSQQSQEQSSNVAVPVPWMFHCWILAFAIYYFIGAQQLVLNPSNLNIVNPAAAALAGNGLIALASFAKRVGGSSSALALITAILLIISGIGYTQLNLWCYYPWAKDGYELGIALQQITQPSDLVVTIANSGGGDPVAIYYSRRRGWVFPPSIYRGFPPSSPQESKRKNTIYWKYPITDDTLIAILEDLITQGADWMGIVKYDNNQIAKDNPKLVAYIQKTLELYQETPKWVIYRIPPKIKTTKRSN